MRTTLLAALIGCSLTSSALAEPPAALDLHFAIDLDGRLLGQPRLRILPGAPSEISLAGSDGSGYRFEVRADPPSIPTDPASIVLTTALHSRVDGAWHRVGEPTLQVALDGRPASIEVGAGDGGAARYRIQVWAKPADEASPLEPIAHH